MKLNLITSITVCCLLLPVEAQADGPPVHSILDDDDAHTLGAVVWVYNDLAEGLKKAKRTNKPLFVTFRSVLCKACESIDAAVAAGSEAIERMAADVEGLEVNGMNTGEPGGPSAKKCGQRRRDIVCQSGRSTRVNDVHRIAFNMKRNDKAGDELPLTVLSNGKRIVLKIKLVE